MSLFIFLLSFDIVGASQKFSAFNEVLRIDDAVVAQIVEAAAGAMLIHLDEGGAELLVQFKSERYSLTAAAPWISTYDGSNTSASAGV